MSFNLGRKSTFMNPMTAIKSKKKSKHKAGEFGHGHFDDMLNGILPKELKSVTNFDHGIGSSSEESSESPLTTERISE